MFFNDFITDHAGHAKELLPSLKRDGVEISKIPTGGVNVGGCNYLAYMSVRNFTQPGQWITNYSGITYSDEKFPMIAYARRDGFVYAFGTPNGRVGDAHVARVAEQRLLDKSAYEYWTGNIWQRGHM